MIIIKPPDWAALLFVAGKDASATTNLQSEFE